jgi:hypothetical protein
LSETTKKFINNDLIINIKIDFFNKRIKISMSLIRRIYSCAAALPLLSLTFEQTGPPLKVAEPISLEKAITRSFEGDTKKTRRLTLLRRSLIFLRTPEPAGVMPAGFLLTIRA